MERSGVSVKSVKSIIQELGEMFGKDAMTEGVVKPLEGGWDERFFQSIIRFYYSYHAIAKYKEGK